MEELSESVLVLIGTLVGLAIIFGLIILIPQILTEGIRALNKHLWLKLNYPNSKDWPKSAYEEVYLPELVENFGHPLNTGLAGVGAIGLLVLWCGQGLEIDMIVLLGRMILTIPVIVIGTFVIGLMWEGYNGRNPIVIRELRAEEAFQALKKRSKEDNPEDMKSLYRLWHSLYTHDRWAKRLNTDYLKYHKMFEGLILPPAVAQKLENAVSRLRTAYNSALENDSISTPIKKLVHQRMQKLDALLKFKTAEERISD